MRRDGVFRVALLCALCAGAVKADIKGLSIYGFMDMIAQKAFLDDNSLFRSFEVDESMRLSIDHINLYIDANPNENVRFLTELSFRPRPVKKGSSLGTDVVIDAGNGMVTVLPLDMARLTDDFDDDKPEKGEVFDWGEFSVERAWFEYRFNAMVALRFGKFITPAGLWNVDHGSPALITIRQPYATGLLQFFPKSQLGIQGHGMAFLGDVDLSYSLYVSTGRNNIDVEALTDLGVGGRVEATVPVLGGLGIGLSGYSAMHKDAYKTRTITVDSATITALTIEAVMETGILDLSDPTLLALVDQKVEDWLMSEGLDPEHHEYSSEYAYKARETSIGADLKLAIGKFDLQGELTYQLVDNHLVSESQTQQLGFYGLASYGIPVGAKLKLTPYIMYERIAVWDADNNPHVYLSGNTTRTPESIIDGFQAFVGGLNIKMATYVTLKLEYVYADLIMRGALENAQGAMDVGFINAQFSVAW